MAIAPYRSVQPRGVLELKKLTEDLKRMLTGLAHQNAGEMLPMHEKLEAVGVELEPKQAASNASRVLRPMPTRKRIAIISDGTGVEMLMDYALHTFSWFGAQFDLLFHGATDDRWADNVVKQLRREGVAYHRVELSDDTVQDVAAYIQNQHLLTYILAQPNDLIVNKLMEEEVLKKGMKPAIPMVLIDPASSMQLRRIYAG